MAPFRSGVSTTTEASELEVPGRLASMPHVGLVDTKNEITLRTEYLSSRETRVLIASVWLTLLLAFGYNTSILIFKTSSDTITMQSDTWFYYFNIIGTGIMGALLLLSIAHMATAVTKAVLSKRHWSRRQRKIVAMSVGELLLQTINVTMMLALNSHSLKFHSTCGFYSKFVTWGGYINWSAGWPTLFLMQTLNSDMYMPVSYYRKTLLGRMNHIPKKYLEKKDAIVLDLPIYVQWFKFLVWALFVVSAFFLVAYLSWWAPPGVAPVPDPDAPDDCTQMQYTCVLHFWGNFIIAVEQSCQTVQTIIFLNDQRNTRKALREEPYQERRWDNIATRINSRLRTLPFIFYLYDVVTFFWVGYGACGAFLVSTMGYLSGMAVMTAVVTVSAYFNTPIVNKGGVLQTWLQEFAWTSKGHERKLTARNALMAAGAASARKEPMFNFETCLEMFVWAFVVYDHDEISGSPYTVERAMEVSNMDHWELLWNKASETKCMLAWRERGDIVVAFRGTASIKNVMHDAQAWRVSHPPKRGHLVTGSRPLVHSGFLRAWQSSKDQVLQRVVDIVKQGTGDLRLYVTGHSLGGALATLATLDIANAIKEHVGPESGRHVEICNYTFGAPRTGNHAFAREYNAAVPDTWSIINQDDIVTRSGKGLILYKRPGHRVLINVHGQIIVRPVLVEINVQKSVGGSSIKEHMMTSYGKALTAVAVAQFTSKGFKDGQREMIALLERNTPLRDVLLENGLPLEECMALANERDVNATNALRKLLNAGMDLRPTRSVELLTMLNPVNCCRGFTSSCADGLKPVDILTCRGIKNSCAGRGAAAGCAGCGGCSGGEDVEKNQPIVLSPGFGSRKVGPDYVVEPSNGPTDGPTNGPTDGPTSSEPAAGSSAYATAESEEGGADSGAHSAAEGEEVGADGGAHAAAEERHSGGWERVEEGGVGRWRRVDRGAELSGKPTAADATAEGGDSQSASTSFSLPGCAGPLQAQSPKVRAQPPEGRAQAPEVQADGFVHEHGDRAGGLTATDSTQEDVPAAGKQ